MIEPEPRPKRTAARPTPGPRPEPAPRPKRTPKPAPSAPVSAERIEELEVAIAYLIARQDAKPKSDVHGRALMALLIAAFERTLERTRAELNDI